MRSITLVVMTGLLTALSALAQEGTDGFVRVGSVEVPLTGREVAIPVPAETEPADLRVVIVGTFTCSLNGRTYDAYAYSGSDAMSALGYVTWSPDGMRIRQLDKGNHRYVLHLPPGPSPPDAVSAWVDTEKLVRELIVTPSEVRDSLSGDLRLELWRAPRDNGLLGMLLPVGGAVLLLAVLAAATARRSRRMADVDEALKRIDRKLDRAKRAARERDWDSEDLERKLDDLQQSARHLAQEIGRFRGIARGVDRETLERDIERTQRRLDATEREENRKLMQSLLSAKLKLREMMEDSEATEQRYMLRLAQIEATLDTLVVQMAEQDGRMAATDADREAIDAVQRELSATDAAIEELKLIEDPGRFVPEE